MGLPILHLLIPKKSKQPEPEQNEYGETALAFAPTIRLPNGEEAVPQQYLNVNRTLENLANVLAQISVPYGYQLFAGQGITCLYLMVGVIGKENYPKSAITKQRHKIVYGRRWMIEPTTPTSEIVQTSLLAIKKAREHEVRELFTVRINEGRYVTTPFNCHLDLPLMVGNGSVLEGDSVVNVELLLENVRFAGGCFSLKQQVSLGRKTVYELMLIGGSTHFPELVNYSIAVICERNDKRDFLHQLIAALIQRSDRHIEEIVAFNGFKRFSHNVDPIELARFSYQTRNIKATDPRFNAVFANVAYTVDASKAPRFNDGELGCQQRELLASYGDLDGYLPLDK